MHLTRIQKMILDAVYGSPDHQLISLFQLVNRLGIHYENARRSVWELQSAGLLRVYPHGRGLILSGVWFDSSVVTSYLTSGGYRGAVTNKSSFTVRRLQSGGGNMSDQQPQVGDYSRPQLTETESDKLARVAVKINKIKDERLRLTYFSSVVYENAILLKEVNEHRARAGLPLLPVYDPEKRSNNGNARV